MPYTDDIRKLIAEALQINDRIDNYDARAPLLGNIPELDSMAVVGIITALEEKFGIVIDDEEINIDTFQSISTLAAFIRIKLANR